MFAKLSTNRFMKATGSDEAAVVESAGKVQRMVNVHQYGLKDKLGRSSKPVLYPARPLLGVNCDDEVFITEVIIDTLYSGFL